MPYSAEISRENPSCMIFLVDQSASMADPFAGGEPGSKKADGVADAVNNLLQSLCIRCAKQDGVRAYFHVGVLGYGEQGVGPAFAGALSGKELVPISEIAEAPARVVERVKKINDGAGGLVEQTVKFPIWFAPLASGGTPMVAALNRAAGILEGWLAQHASCFPPVVINITDGESTDGCPLAAGEAVRRLSVPDGGVLLFNLHLSSKQGPRTEFPNSDLGLVDQYAKQLFQMSSPLTPFMVSLARKENYNIEEGARGFAFNASFEAMINFIDIGTRPANLR